LKNERTFREWVLTASEEEEIEEDYLSTQWQTHLAEEVKIEEEPEDFQTLDTCPTSKIKV
jgi:hypothetical protein